MLTTLWDKIKTWFSNTETTVVANLSKDEQEVLTLIAPIFGAAEAAVVQDLVVFIKGVLTSNSNPGSLSLPDWETAILNGLSKLGGTLEDLAKGLGSNVLQALIGLVLAKLG